MQAAEKNQVSFGMIFNIRMNPAFKKAKELLDQGTLGKISRVAWICNTWYRTPAYHASAPWRSSWKGEGGGLLINQSLPGLFQFPCIGAVHGESVLFQGHHEGIPHTVLHEDFTTQLLHPTDLPIW